MKIPFRKVGVTPQEFSFPKDNIDFNGSLSAYKRNLVRLDGVIQGSLELTCDLCAENYDTILDEKLTILISDGIYQGSDEDFDVVEIFDGFIDLNEIFISELEMHRSDYHHCPSCSNK